MEILSDGGKSIELKNSLFGQKRGESSFNQTLRRTLFNIAYEKEKEARGILRQNVAEGRESLKSASESLREETGSIFRERLNLRDAFSSGQIRPEEYFSQTTSLYRVSHQASKAYGAQVRRVAKEDIKMALDQYQEKMKEAREIKELSPKGVSLEIGEEGFVEGISFKLLKGEATITRGSIKITLNGRLQIEKLLLETDEETDVYLKKVPFFKQLKVNLREDSALKISSLEERLRPIISLAKEALSIEFPYPPELAVGQETRMAGGGGGAAPVNNSPTANAGPDETVPINSLVSLNGSGSSDPDSDSLTYQWTQAAGPAVTLSDPTAANPTFTPTQVDNYTFQLVVNDGTVNSDPDNVTIFASAGLVNDPPIAYAGHDQTKAVNSLVTLDGSKSSDPNGDSLTYQWSQTGGSPVTLSDSTAANPTFTPTQIGDYTFELVVNDGTVNSPADSMDVAISVVVPDDVYVNAATGDNSYDGSSPTFQGGNVGPKKTIKAGLAITNPGSTCHVAAGEVYHPTGGDMVVNSGVTLDLEPNVIVKFNRAIDDLYVNGTLNAQGTAGNEIIFTSDEDDSAGGDTNNDGAATTGAKGQWGGIIFNAGSSGLLDHFSARYGGSGVYWDHPYHNWGSGALIHLNNSGALPTISNGTITESANYGILLNSSSPPITNNIVTVNGSDGIHGSSSNPTITNNTITANSGNGIYLASSSPSITNNIITGNSSSGIYADGSSSPAISYNDVWSNSPDYGGTASAGTGDISADPLFVNPAAGNYHIQQPTSPCIDVGNNGAPGLPTEDFDGQPRIINGTVDMGADEV